MPQALSARFIASLPFALTGAQQRVLGEVDSGPAAANCPMVRLVQGDVGCGKTVIAAAAAARAVGSGGQAALMAPTELLAEQHWRTLDALVPAAGRHRGAAVRLAAGAHAAQRACRRWAVAKCRSPWARMRCSRKA